MEDCGVTYLQEEKKVDPYQLIASEGANIIRLRIQHSPDWTSCSTLTAIKRSISRAKQKGLKVLLDFYYSDSWAGPTHQIIPTT